MENPEENSSETKLDATQPESEEEPVPVATKVQPKPPKPKKKLLVRRPVKVKSKVVPKKKRVWQPKSPKKRPANMERINELSKPSPRYLLKKDESKKGKRKRPINFDRLKVLAQPQSRPETALVTKGDTTRPINYERMDELAQPHSRFLTNTYDEHKAVMSKKKQARIEALVGELRLITAEEQQAFIRRMTRPKTIHRQNQADDCQRARHSLADKEERLLLKHILSVCLKKLPKRLMEHGQKSGGTNANLLKLMNTAYGNICAIKGWPQDDLQASAYRLVADKIAKLIRFVVTNKS